MGRRVHHQLLPGCERRGERARNQGAGLHANAARFHRDDFVVAGHVEHNAAFERHRLAVVSGAAAPHRHRDAPPRRGCGDGLDLFLGLRLHDDICLANAAVAR